jgi:hypothetical protein
MAFEARRSGSGSGGGAHRGVVVEVGAQDAAGHGVVLLEHGVVGEAEVGPEGGGEAVAEGD